VDRLEDPDHTEHQQPCGRGHAPAVPQRRSADYHARVLDLMFSPEVAEGRASKKPLVALESTLVAHGLPWPENLEVARELEETVRMSGAVPATIAVVDGRPWIGLEDRTLARVAHDGRDIAKAGATDLAVHLARGTTAATTVSATAVLAERAGIRVFAT